MKLMRYLLIAGVGAVIGLLVAPKKGAELRREMEQRLGPLLSRAGLATVPGDQVTMTSTGPKGDELQSKIEETRRRLQEQREGQSAS